jgi:glucokinase
MELAVGIDIGGTKVAIGIIDSIGQVIVKTRLDTDLSITPNEMINRIAHSTTALCQDHSINPDSIIGIGIGAPGPLDPLNGRIINPPNLHGWSNFPLVDEIKQFLPYPIKMENDATAATLAEKWIGAAKHSDNFIFLTISTGIGAGIYLHGRLITGTTGNAGDAGHFVVDPSAGRCSCGQYGCWEWVASGTAISRQASELAGRPISTKEAFDLAAHGDASIQQLIEQTFRYIGVGCVTLINLFDPDTIVIGGGVTQIGEPLFQTVRDYVSHHAFNPSGRHTAIVPAKLMQDAGLIGAAALIHYPY